VTAQQLLLKSGWRLNERDKLLHRGNEIFQFEILLPVGAEEAERVLLIYQSELKKIGIEMKIKSVEWGLFVKKVHDRQFDAYMMSWNLGINDDPYQYWHSSQDINGGSNAVGFKNSQVDKLLSLARVTLDSKERRKIYRKFAEILADEAPYLFLFEKPRLFLIHQRVEGWSPLGSFGSGVNRLEWRIRAKN
jgi:peptide/nickel transport system substrate-binding protein